MLAESWQARQHIIWEIDWPAIPIAGSLTVETWRADDRYRFEILEAPAAALVGEVLVFDGQVSWRYNRFDPPPSFTPTTPSLSPVSDAFAIIDRAIDVGINFLDTANVYTRGRSEEITGEALKRNGQRDRIFLATKVHEAQITPHQG